MSNSREPQGDFSSVNFLLKHGKILQASVFSESMNLKFETPIAFYYVQYLTLINDPRETQDNTN